MATLECLDCSQPARWRIWYKNYPSLTSPPPFPPANTTYAYSVFCDECATKEIKIGREDWHVVCMKLIADSLLPEGDRAKEGKKIVE